MDCNLKFTFEDGSEALVHYGVKGMKWGNWNADTKARYSSEGKTIDVDHMMPSASADMDAQGVVDLVSGRRKDDVDKFVDDQKRYMEEDARRIKANRDRLVSDANEFGNHLKSRFEAMTKPISDGYKALSSLFTPYQVSSESSQEKWERQHGKR